MKILVLNCGSSSIKYKLIEMDKEQTLADGIVEKIGLGGSCLTHIPAGCEKVIITDDIYDHTMGIEMVIAALTNAEHGVIQDKSAISGIGHRVVHGGEKFHRSVIIDDEVIREISDCIELAPLHNPHNLRGIQATLQLFSESPQVAVFDTAFHQTIPDYAYLYALPYVLYTRYQIRRYGFHGTSHYFIANEAARLLARPLADLKLITCHLGNGASMAAIDAGKVIDTSMGFTPLEGLMMGTRCGDMDPAIILYLIAKEELTMHEANTLMNKHSGLQGLSGVSSDMRTVIEEMNLGNPRASVAFAGYCYRVKKYIGSYAAALGGLDAVVFSAGIGENSALVRQECCAGLTCLGLALDEEKNKKYQPDTAGDISQEDSPGRILVVPTDEEMVIARDTRDIITQLSTAGKKE